MDTVLKLLKMAALLSVTFACGAIGFEVLQARHLGAQLISTLQQSSQDEHAIATEGLTALAAVNGPKGILAQIDRNLASLDATLKAASKVGVVLDKTSATLDNVNRLCNVPGKPCGTLADVAEMLKTVRGTFGQIEVAARHENQNLTTIDAQERELFGKFDQTLTAVDATVVHFDTLVSDPAIPQIVGNAEKITASGAVIIKDGEIEANRFTFPPKTPWYKKIIPTTLKIGMLIYDFKR